MHLIARSLLLGTGVLSVGGCAHKAPQFGAERTMPAAQRPLAWNAADKERLLLPDMRAPRRDGEAAFTAELPGGWEPLPPDPGNFKDLYWRVGGQADAECYLTGHPVGALQPNLTRWYGQFGQVVSSTAQIASLPTATLLGSEARVIEIEGTFTPRDGRPRPGFKMLLLAVVAGDAIQATLKCTGPKAIVDAQREAFMALARSIRTGAPAAAPAGDPPPGAGAMTDPGAMHAAPIESPFTAKVANDWQPVAGSSKFLHHRFGTAGEIYVGQLGGDLRPMLDIWRGEMGQGQLDDNGFKTLARTPMLGAEAMVMDLRGDFTSMGGTKIAGARMLVAAARVDGATVFVKCFGPAAEVEQQLGAFAAFCASMERRP